MKVFNLTKAAVDHINEIGVSAEDLAGHEAIVLYHPLRATGAAKDGVTVIEISHCIEDAGGQDMRTDSDLMKILDEHKPELVIPD